MITNFKFNEGEEMSQTNKARASREQMWGIFQTVLDSLIEDLENPEPKLITQAMQFLKNNGITLKNGADPEDVKDGLLGLQETDLEGFEESLSNG